MFFGSESSNNGEFLSEGSWKLVRIKEIIELWEVELLRVNCISGAYIQVYLKKWMAPWCETFGIFFSYEAKNIGRSSYRH